MFRKQIQSTSYRNSSALPLCFLRPSFDTAERYHPFIEEKEHRRRRFESPLSDVSTKKITSGRLDVDSEI